MAGAGAIRAGRVAIEIGADAKKFYAALNALESRMKSLGATVSGIGVRLAGLGAAASAPFALAVKQTADFQDTMAAVGAVTGATGADFDALKKKALDLGASTSFTAQQVAEGMQALGQGGFTVGETLSGIQGTLLLARAGMLDLGTATSITVAVLRSFKMPAEDAGKVADVLAMAANSSNASVQGLGEALSTVGGIAYTAGVSLTELTAAVGLLADRGMQGSEAGTALRRVLIGLSQEQEKLRDLGIEVKDPKTGKLKPLKQILKELQAAMAGMAETDKIAKLSKIFDVFGANAVLQLMNAGDSLGDLDQKLQNAEGSAADVAKKMDDTLGGSFRMLSSAVEAVALAIGDALSPSLRSMLQYLTAIAGGIARAVQSNQEWVVSVAKAIAGVSGAGLALVGLGGAIQVVAFGFGGLAKALAVVSAPMLFVLKTASAITGSFASAGRWVAAVGNTFIKSAVGVAVFATRATAMSVAYTASIVAMVGRTAAATTAIAASWAIRATIGLAAFAAEVKARITYYTGMLSFMVARTVAQGGVMAAFWINEAARGIIGFVSQFVVGAATYVATTAGMVASSAAAAGAMAAAWLAPIAPIIGLVAAIGGIGVALKSTLSNSGSVASTLGSLFEPLSAGFQQVLADATKVFSDLWSIATETFAGISNAVMAGDLALAFDVLWAGLKVAWLRGQQGVMSYVDTFVEYLQNRFGDAVTWIAQAMTRGLGLIQRAWIATTGFLFQAWQTAINRVLNVWDSAVGAIQKAIAYIRSFFDESIDYDAVKKQIDTANEERRKARDRDEMAARDGTSQKLADQQSAEDQTVRNIEEENQRAQADRQRRSDERAAQRQGQVDAAQGELDQKNQMASAAKESVDIENAIGEAVSTDELRDAWERAKTLFDQGLISAERLAQIEEKLDDKTEEVNQIAAANSAKAAEDAAAKESQDAVKAASDQSAESDKIKNETAGTFSAYAAMYLGGGGSAAERTARATEETARNTKNMTSFVGL